MATAELRENLDRFSVAVLTAAPGVIPTFIGTGFCVQLAKRTYFITAAHVIDSIIDGLFLGKRAIKTFASNGFITRRESEQLDLAVLPITDEQMSEIGIEPILEAQIDKVGVYRDGFHCLMGYPVSKNKLGGAVRMNEGLINSVCYGINTERTPVDYGAYGKTEQLHIAVKYDTAVSDGGRVYQPPSLRGVSGAPLWITKDKLDYSKVLLGGFLIEYHRKGKVAFCTNMEHAVGFIRARYA